MNQEEIKKEAKKKYDVVWMLGSGSGVRNWEVRQSMRSFHRHFRDLGKMWIIGTIPDWVDREKVRCIDHPDPYHHNKDANLFQKAIWLSGEAELSEDYVLCSDDQYLLKSAEWADFKSYHAGDLATKKWDEKPTGWFARLYNTYQYLKKRKLSTWHCDAHIPYPVNKTVSRDLLRAPYGVEPGLTIFSAYCNMAAAADPERFPIVSIAADRIRAGIWGTTIDAETVYDKLEKNLFGSSDGDSAHNWYFQAEMEHRFPDSGDWELDQGGESLAGKHAEKHAKTAKRTLALAEHLGG